MKILILGAGQVGSTIAENLVSENNDITLVDEDFEQLKALQDRLDVRTILGNAAHPSVLKDADAENTDLLLALTRDDETNLVACSIAKLHYNIPTRIARIRSSDYVLEHHSNILNLFSVNHAICPEQIITNQLQDLFKHPGSLQIVHFADGEVLLVASRVQSTAKMAGKTLSKLKELIPKVNHRIVAIYHKHTLIIPDENTLIQEGDELFFLAHKKDVDQIVSLLRKHEKQLKHVMIAGGGNIGFRLAKSLEEQNIEVKLIEKKHERCEWLVQNLDNTMVFCGESTDEALLEQEQIGSIDVFCALTNDDEDNIMSSLLAKQYGAKKVVSIINRSRYAELLQGDKIDVVISPHLSTIGEILEYIRPGDVQSVHALRRGEAEAIEVILHGDKQHSKLIGCSIKDITLPQGCFIVGVIRDQKFLMPTPSIVLQSKDHLIFFISQKQLIRHVEKLIQVDAQFL
jgi:trk system potassium uptake protein TrkA